MHRLWTLLLGLAAICSYAQQPLAGTRLHISDEPTTPGFNYGATGFVVSSGWYGTEAFGIYQDVYTQGMYNVFNTEVTKYGAGDFNGLDLNMHTRGGQVDSAAEGLSGIRNYMEIGLSPYLGTVGAVNGNSLTMSWANNRLAGVGQVLIDLSRGQTCNIISTSVVDSGHHTTYDGYVLAKTDCTFPVSQQITLAVTNTAVSNPQNVGSVQPLTVSVKDPLIVNDLVCLGGVAPECLKVITASDVNAGQQTITGVVRFQHWNGTIGFVNGVTSSYLEQTKFTKNGLRFVSNVLGSPDGISLAVYNSVPGGMDPGYIFTGQATIYPGAVITDVRDPGMALTTGYYIKVADNNVNWALGDTVEGPNAFTAWWKGYTEYISNNNPTSTGSHFSVYGRGSSFGGVPGMPGAVFHIVNNEPSSSYDFYTDSQGNHPGYYHLIPTFSVEGETGTAFDYALPPHGSLFLMPGDNVGLVTMKNHNAGIGFDTANGGDGEWSITADNVSLPNASFSRYNPTSFGNTVIQGKDGAGSASLHLLAPLNSMYGTTSLLSEGDVVIKGKCTIYFNGKPYSCNTTNGLTATKTIGACKLSIVNGLIKAITGC